MKMRKRIAALLAVAMIATVMPMTAFAASSNRVTNTVTVAKDQELTEGLAPRLVIEFKDSLTSGQAFYLELENAEWLKDGEFDDAKTKWEDVDLDEEVVLDRVGSKTLEVKASGNLGRKAIIEIPLYTKATGGDATVIIDSFGTVVDPGKYVFAVSDDSDAKVKVGDVETFVETGEMAKITIEEPYAGAFESEFNDDKDDQKITLELDHDDFMFEAKGVAKGIRGFGFENAGVISDKGQKLTFTIKHSDVDKNQKGIIEIKDVTISADRKATEGDVSVYISSDFLDNETLVVAKFGDFSTELTTKEVKDYTAGRVETLKFKLEEVGEAIIRSRAVDFILSEDIKIVEVKANGKELDNEVINSDDENEFRIASFTTDKQVSGVQTAFIDDGEVEFEVKVEIPAKFEGDLTVKAEGRAIEETKELKLAEVKVPVTVKVEPMKIDVGQKSNKGGKITITETDKGMIQRKTLVIQLPKDLKDDGVEFMNVDDLVIETTGGILTKDAKYDDDKSAITIEVTRQSKEAGSIEISGFEVKSRRMIADGAYEVEIGGTAISKDVANLDNKDKGKKDDKNVSIEDDKKYENIDAITAVDFLLVGDLATKAEVKFVIGSNKFLVDGKERTMDAAAFIKDGRTMVPLRYLSVAIGIDEEAIKFNAGVITIIDGMRIIQLQNGSKNLVVNGMTIPMSAAAEIIDGRTYVPVSEIGAVFNVAGTWDPAAQTATFK